MRRLGIALAATLVLGAGTANAATPYRKGLYQGRTSQGLRVGLYIDRDGQLDNAEIAVRLPCGDLGQVARYNAFAFSSVSPSGRLTDTQYDTHRSDFDTVTKNGTIGFDTSRCTAEGRFTSHRRATGTWRVQSLILSPGTFPYDPSLVGSCYTGVVRWSATFKRRTTPTS